MTVGQAIGQRGERASWPWAPEAGVSEHRLKLLFVALASPYPALSCASPAQEGGAWLHRGPAGEIGQESRR